MSKPPGNDRAADRRPEHAGHDTARGTPPNDRPPQSPCINVCRVRSHDELCIGCLRSLDEIGGWSGFSDEQKRAVLERVDARRLAEGRRPRPV